MQKVKNIIKFLIFIIYTIAIFFIKNPVLIFVLFMIDIILFFICKLDYKNLLYNLKWASFIIIFTVVINIIFDSLYTGILFGIRLVICYFTTYIFSKNMKIFELAEVIETLFYPLKIFKINSSEIGIIISIAVCMIPVLRSEIYTINNSLISKGQRRGISFIKNAAKPLMISILKKTDDMEKSLTAKAYK